MGSVNKCPKSDCFVICNGDCLHCDRTYFGGKTLIEKEALMKDLEDTLVFSGREGHVNAEIRGANKVISRIKAAPTIEVYKSQCVKDLVDRATVLRVVCEGCNIEFSEEPCEPDSCAIKIMLEGLPTVTLDDLLPKGRWIPQDDSLTRFMCSECKAKNYGGYEKFCPNCGAKMTTKEK